MCLCVFVPSAETLDRMKWRLLVQERIDKIANHRNYFFLGLDNFCFPKTKNVSLWGTILLCIVGDFTEGGSVTVAIDVAESLNKCATLNFVSLNIFGLFLYWCYSNYPHRSRYSVSNDF